MYVWSVLLKQQVRCFNLRFPLRSWCNQSTWLLKTYMCLWYLPHCCFSRRVPDGPVPAQLHLSLALRAGRGAGCRALPAGSCCASLGIGELLEATCWRGAAVSVSLLVPIEPKVLLLVFGVFFYCLFTFLPVHALLLQAWKAETFRNSWSCWVRRKPYQRLLWIGVTESCWREVKATVRRA